MMDEKVNISIGCHKTPGGAEQAKVAEFSPFLALSFKLFVILELLLQLAHRKYEDLEIPELSRAVFRNPPILSLQASMLVCAALKCDHNPQSCSQITVS